jgi:hypothetical protein
LKYKNQVLKNKLFFDEFSTHFSKTLSSCTS